MNDEAFKSIAFDNISKELSDRIIGCAGVVQSILNELENSRERSVAVTKLEETVMWANKAIKESQLKREGASHE